VNQAYVIATSKKVDVSGVKLPDNVNDAFFVAEGGKDTTDFFSTDKPKVRAFVDVVRCCSPPAFAATA
jgi:large subunit ribosomal protein L6e